MADDVRAKEHADDFALARVTPDKQKHWFGIAVQRFGQVSALSQFLLGATLGYAMTAGEAFLALILGSVLLEVIIVIVGIIGQKEGLNTSLLARWTGFGEIGASLVGLAIGISLIGWFGIQSAISAESLNTLMPGVMPMWLWSLLFGLAVTAIVAVGFVGMQWLANITVPLFLILVGWAVISELTKHDFMELMTMPAPGPTMSIAAGTAIVAGGLIVGAIITSDMTRFNRSAGDVVKQTVVGVTLGEVVIGMAGVLLSHAALSGDIVAIVTSSVGFVGLLIIISGTLKINDWNLYSSTLGLVNFFSTVLRRDLNRVSATIVLGVVGSVLAAAGILGRFTDFLTVLGVAFPPDRGHHGRGVLHRQALAGRPRRVPRPGSAARSRSPVGPRHSHHLVRLCGAGLLRDLGHPAAAVAGHLDGPLHHRRQAGLGPRAGPCAHTASRRR